MRKRLLAIVATAALVVAMVPSMAFAETADDWGKITLAGTTEKFDTFAAAMAHIDTNNPANPVLVCDSGKLIAAGGDHISVTRSVAIKGNGATIVNNRENDNSVKGGEADFAIDIYKDLVDDTTITIEKLYNAAVWGTRDTEHTLTVNLIDCDTSAVYNTGQRVYITGPENGTNGKNIITIKDCDYTDLASNCTIYSNAAGSVTVENCTFKGINEPININTKVTSGAMKTTVKDCKFTDCGLGNAVDSQWAAPIRVVNSGGANVALDVDNCKFNYTGTNESANGDVLVGDGRENSTNNPIAATVTNSDAEIQVQKTGYYVTNVDTVDKVKKNVTVTTVAVDEKATVGTDGKVTVSDNTQTGTKPGADKPDNSPNTGDNSALPFAVAGIALAAMAAVVATRRREN